MISPCQFVVLQAALIIIIVVATIVLLAILGPFFNTVHAVWGVGYRTFLREFWTDLRRSFAIAIPMAVFLSILIAAGALIYCVLML